MTPTQALTAIQTMADHSQKWYDGTSCINTSSSNDTNGLAAVIRPHLDKECPLSEEVKQVDEVKYGEFGRPAPFNVSSRAKFCVVPPGYYTRTDNETPSGEKKPNMVKTINKYMEESTKRQVEQDEWLKTFAKTLRIAELIMIKSFKNLNLRTPLYTPLYYSPEEIKYFSSNSEFSDDEKSKTSEVKTLNVIPEWKSNLPEQTVNHYVEPYVPSIPFPNRLKQHAEEALLHKTIESLKKIKINRPLLKEIRQTDNYPKYIKDLVANKQLINHSLNRSRLVPQSSKNAALYYFNHLLSIDPDVFTYDIEVQESYEEFVYKCSLTAQETNGANPFEEKCDGDSLCHNEIKCYWESENDGKQIEVEWENLRLNDWLRIRFGEVSETTRDKILRDHWRKRFGNEYDDSKEFEDPDGCRESKENEILGTVLNKLHDEWFKGTDEDDDDLEGIIDYLEPTLYDVFVDSDDEEYKERKCRLLGMPYIKPPPILIEKVNATRYSIGPGEVYTKINVSRVEELSRTRGNIATIRAGIIDEIIRNDDNEESYDKT
ncbi:hypothetical protein Tco_1087475 [Tanacetum coccineum]